MFKRNSKTRRWEFCVIVFLALFISSGSSTIANSTDDKLKPEQIVEKHLESIGSPEDRSSVTSITAVGTATATFRGRGEGRAEGIAVVASKGQMNMIGMKFNNSDYPFERFGYNGKDFSAGFVRPGDYTVLGQFMRVNAKSFRIGIMGGTMSNSWELHKSDLGGGKLRARGTSKINGVDTYKISYSPKGGSDLNITLYFDSATFRHVRTEYTRVISAAQGATIDSSSRQSETRYKMVEDFSDFRKAGNLTLPYKYNLDLEILTGNGTASYSWEVNLQEYSFNSDMDDSEFSFATN